MRKIESQIIQENIIPYTQINKKFWIQCAGLFGVVVFCYAKVFAGLINTWWLNNAYSHGFLIPLLSLYFIWIRKDRLSHIAASSSYFTGIPILFLGLSMLLIGHASGVILIQELSFVFTIIGIVLLLLGAKFLKVLWFPIFYLLFMMPSPWEILTTSLHLPFQIFTATIGVKMLHLIGIPAYRESIFIALPNITLEVAKVCSGVNYLFAVIAIGIPLAYITLRSWLRRIALVSGAVFIAILANGMRVALIGMLSYFDITEVLHGPYHVLQALFVSYIGFIVLFTGAWALSEGSSAPPYRIATVTPSVRPLTPQAFLQHPMKRYPIYLAAGILLIIGSYINFYHPSPVPLERHAGLFPYEIGKWKAVDSKSDYGVFSALGFDSEIVRIYKSRSNEEIQLYIGYFASQKHGKELVNYKTKEFHLGADKTRIALNSAEVMEVNRLIKQEGRNNRVILFWYDLNGRVVTDRYKAKAYTAWDAIINGRTNGSLIMVSGDFGNVKDQQVALEDAEDFIRGLIPILRKYLP